MDVNEKLKLIDDLCNYYILGKEIYEICVKSIGEKAGTEMIVSPANLGDTIFIATLSSAYKKVHNINHLLICAKRRQAQAAECFEGVDGVLELEDYQMICLRYYFTISRKFYENGIRYGHIPCDIEWSMPGCFYHIPPGFGEIPLKSVWERRILDLPDDSPTCEIVVSENDIPWENQGIYNNAVLIAPAAFTNKGIPESFWEKLVKKLNEKGYKLYCNSGGLNYDMVISGSTELLLNTKELIVNASFFKHVVAVRSGFTDLVTKTDARMTVIHLGGSEEGPLRVEYGSIGDDVRDLGRMDGIYPIKYNAQREDEIIGLIIEDIDS
ncbi:MAG: hypothetical protein K6G27_08945 [Lachnospiraceae bacterium]|nr:hypothetical protein [Lachnospiraceae bacterium]